MSDSQVEAEQQPVPRRRTKASAESGTSVGEFTLIAGVAVAVALGMSYWMRSNAPASRPTGGMPVGVSAPELDAPFWINGKPDAANGRVRVVHGWFPACPHCSTEAPELVALHQKYGDRVQFIGLSPWGDDQRTAHEAFVERHGFDWPNGYEATETLLALGSQGYFPAAWIVDGEGNIVWNSDQEMQGVSLRQGIENALQ